MGGPQGAPGTPQKDPTVLSAFLFWTFDLFLPRSAQYDIFDDFGGGFDPSPGARLKSLWQHHSFRWRGCPPPRHSHFHFDWSRPGGGGRVRVICQSLVYHLTTSPPHFFRWTRKLISTGAFRRCQSTFFSPSAIVGGGGRPRPPTRPGQCWAPTHSTQARSGGVARRRVWTAGRGRRCRRWSPMRGVQRAGSVPLLQV